MLTAGGRWLQRRRALHWQLKDKNSSPLSSLPQLAQMVARPNMAVGAVKSVTRGEIDRYWRLKKMEELAALKAAARIKARTLSEEDYRRFNESLMDMIKRANEGMDGDNDKEMRVGIKDWGLLRNASFVMLVLFYKCCF